MQYELYPRRWAERISRGRAFWRHLPTEFGSAPLRVTPDAALSFLKLGRDAFDPMLLRLCREHVRRTEAVWDIGANVGIFSLAAATRGGRVLAVEPDPWLYSLLTETRHHRKNQQYELEPLCAALAEVPGTAHLAIAARGRASNYLERFAGRSDAGGIRSRCLVPVLTLDLLLQGRQAPSLVKIDVEGAELAILRGASNLLEMVRPKLLIEVGDSTRDEVIDILHTAQYRVADYETGLDCTAGEQVGTNLMAVPL